jgi:hypothetical protein
MILGLACPLLPKPKPGRVVEGFGVVEGAVVQIRITLYKKATVLTKQIQIIRFNKYYFNIFA